MFLTNVLSSKRGETECAQPKPEGLLGDAYLGEAAEHATYDPATCDWRGVWEVSGPGSGLCLEHRSHCTGIGFVVVL